MFGLLTSLFSVASIAYPFYKTLNTMLFLESAYNANAVSTITDTVILQHKDAINVQESITYWILLSFWFYFLNLSPVAFLAKILPLSSFAILYIQVWLGFPIVPVADKKISGASMIYHYYFDNNMQNLLVLKNQYNSTVGNMGIKMCHFINTIPKGAPILAVLGTDLGFAEQYFTTLSQAKNNTEQDIGIVGMFTSIFVNYDNANHDTLFTVVLSSLVSPFGYAVNEYNAVNKLINPTANPIPVPNSNQASTSTSKTTPPTHPSSLHPSQSNQSMGASCVAKDSATPSPARSFDDFAIVSENDLLVTDDLNATMRKSKRGSVGESSGSHNDESSNERTSLLGTVRNVSGTRHSSWFSRH